jgi:hypothetical protein
VLAVEVRLQSQQTPLTEPQELLEEAQHFRLINLAIRLLEVVEQIRHQVVVLVGFPFHCYILFLAGVVLLDRQVLQVQQYLELLSFMDLEEAVLLVPQPHSPLLQMVELVAAGRLPQVKLV